MTDKQPRHLAQLKEQAFSNLTKREFIFNPSKTDFNLTILGYEINVPSREVKEMTYNQASIVKKRLVDQLINEREIGYPSPEKIEELLKEIEVEI